MAEVVITDNSLTSLKDKVVIVTGSSSGIGLSAVQLLLSLGAVVIGVDVREPAAGAVNSSQFAFHQASVAEWQGLVGAFKKAIELHGRVNHVFANAGTGPVTDYVSGIELDDNGDPKEPATVVLDVNLKGAVNTVALAVHYLRQNADGGSIAITSSTTGLHRFCGVDYSVAKHGTIGLMRSMHSALTRQDIPVRINAIAPSWTATGMVMEQVFKKFGVYTQSSDVVARAAAMLMADESRSGHLIHVDRGVYKEVDEAYLLPAFDSLMHKDTANEDDTFWRVAEAYAEASKQNAQAAA